MDDDDAREADLTQMSSTQQPQSDNIDTIEQNNIFAGSVNPNVAAGTDLPELTTPNFGNEISLSEAIERFLTGKTDHLTFGEQFSSGEISQLELDSVYSTDNTGPARLAAETSADNTGPAILEQTFVGEAGPPPPSSSIPAATKKKIRYNNNYLRDIRKLDLEQLADDQFPEPLGRYIYILNAVPNRTVPQDEFFENLKPYEKDLVLTLGITARAYLRAKRQIFAGLTALRAKRDEGARLTLALAKIVCHLEGAQLNTLHKAFIHWK